MKISVCMCSFNGASFIREQIESILAQTVKPDEIVICDDGSTDGTAEFLSDLSKRSPVRILLAANPKRLGVVANFSQAISLAGGDRIFLSDQDDIWIEDKIEQTLPLLEKNGNGGPVLVHTDLEVVDRDLRLLHKSFIESSNLGYKNLRKQIFTQNFITGCTMAFNRELADLCLPIPKCAPMHDWWIAMVAATVGRVEFLPRRLVLYRQHGANEIGAKGYLTWSNVKKWITKEIFCISDKREMNRQIIGELISVSDKFAPQSAAAARRYLSILNKRGLSRAVRLMAEGYRKEGAVRNMLWFASNLAGR